MTEPVAYVKIKDGKVYSMLRTATPNDEYTPVYTAEQLHSRVKMTQAEFDEFVDLASYSKLIGVITHLYEENRTKYPLLFKRFSGDDDTIKLAVLWSNFDPENPEETIEIVPDMKWFVERNDTSDEHRFLSKNVTNLDNELNYAALKKSAKQFDTKSEAEKWTNPLTEAVQLPVEGKIK